MFFRRKKQEKMDSYLVHIEQKLDSALNQMEQKLDEKTDEIFALFTQDSAEDMEEMEKAAKEQMAQMQQLVIGAMKIAISEILSDEENQKQLALLFQSVYQQATTQQVPRDKHGNIDFGEILAAKLTEMFNSTKPTQQLTSSSNSSNYRW